jgi:hypothetical protein
VKDTPGAEFHKDLVQQATDKVVRKGTSGEVDSYSGFCDVDPMRTTGLSKMLRQTHVTDVYITGLTLDGCVGQTALGAAAEGFKTYIVLDATRQTDAAAVSDMKKQLSKAGVQFITSVVILEQLENKDDRRTQAADYLEDHNISLLFNKLCTQLVYHKPDDPKGFLVKEIQKMQQQTSEMTRLTLLTSEDIDTMFRMLDPIGTGALQGHQIIKALAGLGLQAATEIVADDTFNVTKFMQIVTASTEIAS